MSHPDAPRSPKNSTNVRNGERARQLALLRGALGWAGRISPSLAAAAALRLFLTPVRHRRPPREHEVLARAVPVLGADGVAAWQWGAGPTVLLVHGWEGRGAQLGAFVQPLVEAGFRVVAFDAPAHGHSPGSQATLVDFADAIASVVARVGEPCAVVGHSFGCAALTLAMSRGLRPRAAVFIAPPVRLEDGERAFARALGLSDSVRARMRASIEARVGVSLSALDGARMAGSLSTPLLVIHDKGDEEVPWSAGAELARAWPRATLLSTVGLGHRRILRDPGVVSAAVELIDALAPDPRAASDLDRELDVLLDGAPRRRRRWRASPLLPAPIAVG